jgi:arylsulfatase A-like enzyme/tetratricopeptide (TPR) repeat protein
MKSAGTICVAALLLVVAAGCARPDQQGEAHASHRRVVLITIDTCRADHLGSYGFPQDTTPNLDALAGDGVRFTAAYSAAPITRPAHASLLTGLIPPAHGVRDNAQHSLPSSFMTLAELLGGDGFSTGAFISSFVLDSRFGLDQGFDTYDDEFESPVEELGVLTRKGEETSRRVVDWLKRHLDEDFFLFVHYWDPHVEYRPPEPFASRFQADPYAGEIAYADFCIGQVLDELKRLGLFEGTLIIVTADHGEMLGEHGESQHGFFIYRSSIRVPLIVKAPGVQTHRTVHQSVGLVDVMPTVCSFFGIEPPEGIQGRDLGVFLGPGSEGVDDHGVYTESLWPTKYGGSPLTGIVSGTSQFIKAPTPELYNLEVDPGQLDNLAASRPVEAGQLEDALRSILKTVGDSSLETSSSGSLDSSTRQKLRALGYLPDLPVDDAVGFEGTDAKDLISLHEASAEVLTLMSQDRLSEARRVIGDLLARWPDSPQAHFDLGWIALKEGRTDDAVQAFNHYLQARPESSLGHFQLGMALAAGSRSEAAIRAFREALRLKPDYGEAAVNLGHELGRLGRFSEAIPAFESALLVNPENSQAEAGLGEAFARGGRIPDAAVHYRRAISLEPENLDLLNNFGLFLVASGRAEEAVEVLGDAVMRDPQRPQLHFNLAIALGRSGRRTEAIAAYRRVVALDRTVQPAFAALGDLLYEEGDAEGAVGAWEEALELEPESPEVLNSLAWVLATGEIGASTGRTRAVDLALRACRLTNDGNPAMLDTLATALAAVGRVDEARETSLRASGLATSMGRLDLAARIDERRTGFGVDLR